MTYSGLLMLVIGVAVSRASCSGRRDRTWAALVMPALAVAVALTFTRNTAVGACVAAALLFSLKDFRLFARAADRRRDLPRGRARPDREALRLDVQPERSDRSRPRRDAAHRRADDSRRTRSPASGRTWCERAVRAVPRSRRRQAMSTRTSTTSRCRSRPSAGCRRWRIWLWFIVALVRRPVETLLRRPASRCSRRPRSRRSSPCSLPDCSSTTSATPKS